MILQIELVNGAYKNFIFHGLLLSVGTRFGQYGRGGGEGLELGKDTQEYLSSLSSRQR